MRNTILALLLLAATIPVQAQQRSVLFYWENDSLGSPFGQATDDDYTNGLRLMIGSPGPHPWADLVQGFYCGHIKCGNDIFSAVSYGFTHQFYTPRNIVRAAPQPRDRPWAGYMNLSARLELTNADRQHTFEGQLGILGQGAGAQYVQSKWHQLISAETDPAGWHNQLKNEPMVNLIYGYSRRFHTDRFRYADAIVTPGFALGTLVTYPSLGGTVRLGGHITGFPVKPIGPEISPPPLQPDAAVAQAPAPAAQEPPERPRTEAYFMAGVDARYVLHNSTLDGGFFRDGPSVPRVPFVHDTRLGFSVRRDSFRVSYNFVMRSKEFTPLLPGRDGSHNYHSLAIGWEPAR